MAFHSLIADQAKLLLQSQVYVQVQMLFKDAPDLLAEFKDFLPEVAGGLPNPGHLSNHSNMLSSSANYGDAATSGSPDKGTKKASNSAKRKKRPEKEPTPVPPPSKPAPSRVC